MKAELRKKILQEMKTLSQEQKQAMDRVLTEGFLQHPFYQEAKTIATYLSFPHEFQTQELIDQALKDDKKVLIPKTYPKGRMEFVVYNPQQLVKTSFGLLEPKGDLEVVDPSQIDLIHVPGLAFTREGVSDWIWWRILRPLSRTFCWAYHEYNLSLSSSGV